MDLVQELRFDGVAARMSGQSDPRIYRSRVRRSGCDVRADPPAGRMDRQGTHPEVKSSSKCSLCTIRIMGIPWELSEMQSLRPCCSVSISGGSPPG